MRKRDFAGTGHDAAADEAGVGDGVMRGAERPLSHEALRGIEYAGEAQMAELPAYDVAFNAIGLSGAERLSAVAGVIASAR